MPSLIRPSQRKHGSICQPLRASLLPLMLGTMRRSSVLLLVLCVSPLHADIDAGVAQVDITPDYPIRLSGFGARRTESEGIWRRIKASALALDDVVWIAVDNLGVPAAMTADIAKRLGIPVDHLAISCTHTHTAPMLAGVAPTLFGMPIPPEHQEHIDRYTRELTDKLTEVGTCRPRRSQAGEALLGRRLGRIRHQPANQGRADRSRPAAAGRARRRWQVASGLRQLRLPLRDAVEQQDQRRLGRLCAGGHRGRLTPVPSRLCRSAAAPIKIPTTASPATRPSRPRFRGGRSPAKSRRAAQAVPCAGAAGRSTTANRQIELPLADLPTRARLGREGEAHRCHRLSRPRQLARLDSGEPLTSQDRLCNPHVDVRRRSWRWSSCPARSSSITRCG